MPKYTVTLEIESEKTIEQLVKPSWGALLIGAENTWQVIETREEASE
jgi:hypothetical protein